LVVIVLVNRKLGRVANEVWGPAEAASAAGCELVVPDFCKMAEAHGGVGIRIASSDPDEVSRALDQALACQRLCVLEVMQDPAVKPLMAKRGSTAKQSAAASSQTPSSKLQETCPVDRPAAQRHDEVNEPFQLGRRTASKWARRMPGCSLQVDPMEVLAVAGRAQSLLQAASKTWTPPACLYLGPKHYVTADEAVAFLPMERPWPSSLAPPSRIANSSGEELGFQLDPEASAAFDAAWRTALRPAFAGEAALSALDAYLESGLSKGRQLFFCVLALPPNTWTKVHAHPNIEFAACLAGTLHEVRLAGPPWPLEGRGPYSVEVDGDAPEPPNLNMWAAACKHPPAGDGGARAAEAGAAAFERQLRPGDFLANDIGSVHQSYTCDDGCLLLVLWSGCHANIRPCQCDEVSSLFRPSAGWDSGAASLKHSHSGGL